MDARRERIEGPGAGAAVVSTAAEDVVPVPVPVPGVAGDVVVVVAVVVTEEGGWGEGCQCLIRPSTSVTAWRVAGRLAGCGAPAGRRMLWSVRVQARPGAGVPLKVLRIWQVIGSRSAIFLCVFVCAIQVLVEEGRFFRFPSASCGVSLNGKVFDYFCIFINFIFFHLLSLIFEFEAQFRDVETWPVC